MRSKMASSRMLPRLVVLAGLLCVAAIAWVLLWRSAAVMSSMAGEGVMFDLMMAMMRPERTGPYAMATALMWLVMMVAMMTPAVLPVLLTFWQLDRGSPARSAQHGVIFGVSSHWRDGARGAMRMGIIHGSYCLGCCWALISPPKRIRAACSR